MGSPLAGTQTVSVVHVEDAAKLYVQALMLAKAGSAYHAVNGTTTAKQLAEGIAAKHQLPVSEAFMLLQCTKTSLLLVEDAEYGR